MIWQTRVAMGWHFGPTWIDPQQPTIETGLLFGLLGISRGNSGWQIECHQIFGEVNLIFRCSFHSPPPKKKKNQQNSSFISRCLSCDQADSAQWSAKFSFNAVAEPHTTVIRPTHARNPATRRLHDFPHTRSFGAKYWCVCAKLLNGQSKISFLIQRS